MPVLLSESAEWATRLDPASPPERLLELLTPAPDDLLEAHPVTRCTGVRNLAGR